ncbi:DUF1801 domain-containing protein [Ulvibacterium sp.]|uniref:DUF1801 domain-containing protein n=1 Tax=Ulvibacterium sp. TaxID=2665914 RepID=UPI002630C52C|nr:DUF1801 domain-containing protein [Ulvibacterium sp.]
MENDTNNFYFDQPEPNKSCLLAMRDMVLKLDNQIAETRKYGMPCFCYRQKAFCYLWVDKKSKEPYFLMVEGKHLHHPKLETGNRSRMKIFRVNPEEDLPIHTIDLIMNKALDLYKSGVVKLK